MATSSETDETRRTVDKDWLEGRRNLSQGAFTEVGQSGKEESSTLGGRVRGTLSAVAGRLTRR